MSVRTRLAGVFALAFIAGPLAGSAAAETPKDQVTRLLNDRTRGQMILQFLHSGTDYHGHTLVKSGGVTVGGRPVPGHFHLEYEFKWKAIDAGVTPDTTRVVFFFDDRGNLTEIQTGKTTANFNQPFRFANVGLAVFGTRLVKAAAACLTAAQIRYAQALVNAADAKGLLEFLLAVDLALSN